MTEVRWYLPHRLDPALRRLIGRFEVLQAAEGYITYQPQQDDPEHDRYYQPARQKLASGTYTYDLVQQRLLSVTWDRDPGARRYGLEATLHATWRSARYQPVYWG